jgi:acetyl-CoA carboxylase, biotin carboxylase subunit
VTLSKREAPFAQEARDFAHVASDRGSLHVRLADECVQLPDHHAFMDVDKILAIAQERGADAIHPGYGYMAEDPRFIHAVEAAGIRFIGPPVDVVAMTRHKIGTLEAVRDAGIKTVVHSPHSFAENEFEALQAAAMTLGYPLVIKSCSGGRGRGERLVSEPERLAEAVRRSQAEAQTVYGNKQLFLEQAILPAHQVGVQIMADDHGHLIHLGDREGSIIWSNQKIVEEAPALCLTLDRRAQLHETALRIARLFSFRNLSTVEFLVDESGEFYFSEIKARIQIEHTLTEMMTRIDLVREQIRLAAGEELGYEQDDIAPHGHAIMVRLQAEDPSRRNLPSPGRLRRVRLPGGPEIRVDTYTYCDSDVPSYYEPLIAKLTVWGSDRPACIRRLRRALEDFTVIGVPTNLPFLIQLARTPGFLEGRYTTDLLNQMNEPPPLPDFEQTRRDLAVAAAVVYTRRREAFNPQTPDQWATGWHQAGRQLT